MSSTEQNPYDFSRSNTVLKIGGQILILLLILVVVLTGAPPTITPKEGMNSAIRNMVSRIKTNATK